MPFDATDILHEGRITALEVKVTRIVDLTEDLHADMTARKARWGLLRVSAKYIAWVFAGAVSLLGASHSESWASWLNSFPNHH